ncbi:glycosyltransferase family 4 protein [Marinobacter sp. JSM 1782161]|uniref:glycosyltransferase family 4 protein n=1 Tax=Marinobacter sp. JSM 1782161 TaxID=2685906 RepID=UPI0014035FDB|nr:glycosyltransferase family 4 protein [Marinobacter sp. JSM 1782161]
MRILICKPHLDQSELALALSLHDRGLCVRVLAARTTQGREELERRGLFEEMAAIKGKLRPALIRQMRRVIREDRISLIYAIDSSSLANALWATLFSGVHVVGYRGTLSRIRQLDPTFWLGILNPRVARIFCVSSSVYDYMSRFVPRRKLVLNPKGFDPAWLPEASAPSHPILANLPEDTCVCMFIGNTAGRPYKGLQSLIEGFHRANLPGAHLVVLGDHDPQAPEWVAQGPAAGAITLAGRQHEAAQWLHRADIYIQPSLREGLPRAIKEAMAVAVPVIATDIPGNRDLISDQRCGALIPPADPDALARTLQTLHGDSVQRRRLGLEGQRQLARLFSHERTVERTLEACQPLHQAGRPGAARLARSSRRRHPA